MVLLNTQKWDDPLSSVGDYRGTAEVRTVGMFKDTKCCWEAKDGSPASTALKRLLPKINELFQVSGNRVPDLAMVLMDVFMVGEVAEDSTPYIMFSCTNRCKRARIEAMKLVRRSGLLKEFPGLKVGHWEFPPHIPDAVLTTGSRTRSPIARPADTEESSLRNRGPRQALEIFLAENCNGDVDVSSSQNSTIGAIIRFGKCDLYFTAAHMLLPQSDIMNQQRSGDVDPNDSVECQSDYLSDEELIYESDNDDDFVESFRMAQFSPSPPGPDMVAHDIDSPYQYPLRDSGTMSFDTFIPLDSSSAASTPSRTPHFQNGEVFFKSHELDFALLDLSEFELPSCDIPELSPDTVSAIRPGNTEVVARAGLMHLQGVMSGRPSYIRFPRGENFREVYPVYFSTGVQVGDSGILVRDAGTGQIYGHIVVASIASRTAFIVPATQVLQAIPWLSSAATSIYTRLDSESGQFRLIRLLPPSLHGDGICCQLPLASLRDRPEYEAVSYFWDHSEQFRPILLNGQPWNVSPALACLLRRLRHEDAERYVWIDQLCVNQSDLQERAGQVAQIPDIYKHSNGCLTRLDDTNEGVFPNNTWTFSLTPPSMHRPLQDSITATVSQQNSDLASGSLAQLGSLDKNNNYNVDHEVGVMICE